MRVWKSIVKQEWKLAGSVGYKRSNLTCNYCKQKAHKVQECKKWIADDRPSKPGNQKNDNVSKANNASLLTELSVLSCENDKSTCYIDNRATNHLTNQIDLFENVIPFNNHLPVTIANGDSIDALGQGTIRVESCIKGNKHELVLNFVCCCFKICG